MSDRFSDSQLEFIGKFAEALFDGFETMAIPVSQVVRNFETQFDLLGKPARDRMKSILTFRALWLHPLFNDRSLARRREIIEEKLRYSSNDDRQDLARLRSIVYGAYYGHWIDGDEDDNEHNPVHRQIGFTLPGFRKRLGGKLDRKIERVDGREIARAHVLEPYAVEDSYDVIVVGSGSGGAVAARNLVMEHRYKSVLIIESGPFMPSKAITLEERRMGAELYREGTLQTTRDNDVIIFQGGSVGGSPTVNNGICLRMAQDPHRNTTAWNPFDIWKDAFDIDLEDEFMDAYDAVAKRLDIRSVEPRSGRGNGAHLADAWTEFAKGRTASWIVGAKPGWFLKSFGPADTDNACVYCGYCNTGCPYARKLSPAQTDLPEACNGGARILARSTVDEIVIEHAGPDGQRRATGVWVRVGGERKPRYIAANVGVVVAAGAIASSNLLDRSGVDNTGKDISLIVASPVIALMHEENAVPTGFTPSWDEDQMTTAVDCGTFLLESHFQPPQSMSMLMPGWFEDMYRRMRAYGRIRSAGILIPIDRAGKLKNDKLEIEFDKANMDNLRLALATLTKVHFAHKAREVWPGLRTGHCMKVDKNGVPPSDSEIDAFFAHEVKDKDDVTLSSAHTHGGNAMSGRPEDGVVDLRCRVHGVGNLLVTDASVFPGNIRVNAHFSTMALAEYATGGKTDPFA